MLQAVPKPQPVTAPFRLGLPVVPTVGCALRGRMRAIVAADMETTLCAAGQAGKRASGFTGDLLQRHRWMHAGETPSERVFVLPGVLTNVHAPQQHWHLAYAPRITLRLAANERAIQETIQPIAPVQIHEHTVQRDGPRFVSTLVERVFRRNERIDTLETVERAVPMALRYRQGAPATAESRIAITPAPEGHVQRVLRAPNAGAKAQAIAQRASAARSVVAAPTRTAQARELESSRQPMQINIEHLADRVVCAIDRRLIAQRERYGRA